MIGRQRFGSGRIAERITEGCFEPTRLQSVRRHSQKGVAARPFQRYPRRPDVRLRSCNLLALNDELVWRQAELFANEGLLYSFGSETRFGE